MDRREREELDAHITGQYEDIEFDYRRERRLDTYRRYNQSDKGRERRERYEEKHPERREARWEPARNAMRRDTI